MKQETNTYNEKNMIDFADWLFLWQQNQLGEWKHQNKNQIVKTTKELLELWESQRTITIHAI